LLYATAHFNPDPFGMPFWGLGIGNNCKIAVMPKLGMPAYRI